MLTLSGHNAGPDRKFGLWIQCWTWTLTVSLVCGYNAGPYQTLNVSLVCGYNAEPYQDTDRKFGLWIQCLTLSGH